jgi:putative ABC transport system permease protein
VFQTAIADRQLSIERPVMSFMRNLTSGLWALFRKKQVEQEMDEELRGYLDAAVKEKMRSGMSPEQALRAARVEMGSVEAVKEEIRSAGWESTIETFWQDVRYGLRQLRRNPGFTVVVVITLALGIGANIAIFTVVNTVLLHPLPYPDSGRIVDILPQTCRGCGASDSVPEFTFWRQNNPGFEDLAAYVEGAVSMNLSGGDRPELVQALKVSRNYFGLFRVNPVLGRIFNEEEDQPGGNDVLIMSYGLWQRRFGGDKAILGRALELGGAAYSVVGVLSPRFKPYPSADVWIPLRADPNSSDQAHTLMVSGRLPRGTTLAQANSWMTIIGKRYVQTHPDQLRGDDKLEVNPMQEQMAGDVRPALLILLGAVGLVLLIACANVANLWLARALDRQKEMAIRSSVGAGRGRIVLQLLTECMLLSLAGGALGLTLGSWGVHVLLAFAPATLPRVDEIATVPALDPWVGGFTIPLSIVTGVVFGLAPALQYSRTDLTWCVKESAGSTGPSLRHHRTCSTLVVAEVAMTMVLLCGAMLLIRSFAALRSVQPGFEPRDLLTMKVALAGPRYGTASSLSGLQRQVVERVEQIPGVELASMASSLPTEPIVDMVFNIPGRPLPDHDKFAGDALWCAVSSNYFETLWISLRSGRFFSEQEPAHTVIVNEAMARRFWPKQNPVGQSIAIGAGLGTGLDQGATEIVGVVGDVHDRLDADPPPTMYQVWSNFPDAGIRLMSQLYPASIAVRTRAGVPPLSVSGAVERTLLAGDTQLPATKGQTMEQVMHDSLAETNFILLLLCIFAAISLVLAAVGIYGVISYSGQQRTRGIGIRLALGAERKDALRLVLGQGFKVILAGVAVGIFGALALTRFLTALLYGVKPTDPLTLLLVSLVLTAVGLAACYIPARRATKVDPMVALRYE